MDPVYYIYKLPDDYEMSDEVQDRVANFARKNNLSNEVMQEMIDLHVELTEDYAARLMACIKKIAFRCGLVVALVAALFFSYNLITY